MTTETQETVETSKASKSVTERIKHHFNELGGYVHGKEVQRLLTVDGKELPLTTINNLAYLGKIEAAYFGSIIVFKKSSVEAYLPVLKAQRDAREKRASEADRVKTKKDLKKQFDALVDEALKRGEMPDMNALKKAIGLAD